MNWINGALFFLGVAIAASAVAFTSIAPPAMPAARIVFWGAGVLFVAMVVMAVVSAIARRRRKREPAAPTSPAPRAAER